MKICLVFAINTVRYTQIWVIDMTEVVAALIWDNDRFLACQRPAHKARGLLWEFVGGKVEPGETREAALIRECREELGVTVKPGSVFMEVVHEYPDLTVNLILYNDARWLEAADIPDYPFCPADKEILEQIMRNANL